MYLKQLQVINYKNIKNAVFNFAKGTNTIIGENDSGKTNAMTALRILLDSTFYFNQKLLDPQDFSVALDDWRGHWIIISACFDEISSDEELVEICRDMIPEHENEAFTQSLIRGSNGNFGTVSLFIRPNMKTREQLYNSTEDFAATRASITVDDYEFFYTTKSQAIFSDPEVYNCLVGNLEDYAAAVPSDDLSLLGSKVNIMEVWQYISFVFIDALRDVNAQLKRSTNPVRRIFDVVQSEISDDDIEEIKEKIRTLNMFLSQLNEITEIGNAVNAKLQETIGSVYSPNIKIESLMKEDMKFLSKYLRITPENLESLDLLGLGHLNMIFIALKLVEFEYLKKRQLVNIMIVEEPEAHIHVHIQRTLFDNLSVTEKYTQVIMTTHSTYLSESSEISKMNILKTEGNQSRVMSPINGLDQFGKDELKLKEGLMGRKLERYLDAKRTTLLFSKGVILVEGDGEEILIPALVKKTLGLSLDELGIGIINVGSVAFENIACIFHENRLQRYCSIITDSDSDSTSEEPEEATRAEVLGKSRQEKLNRLFHENRYVDAFYSAFTLEVDFAMEEANRPFISKVIEEEYIKQSAITKHINHLMGNDDERNKTIKTISEKIHKGWYALSLADLLDKTAIIPAYILKAIVFASQEVISTETKIKAINYTLGKQSRLTGDKLDLIDNKDISIINCFCQKYPNSQVALFIKESQKYGGL